ncbi:myeloid leukemia factor 2 isoform X2 [Sarcophilus harrisii]|uniref:myeloid leukemia factor 2 isoform X2 n=1 Tax=Sarcophilus harrisii TaxID=9305 RepID=UPI00130203A3|nr:myeloid leukemia factor 2 isoform X2 [Sarcophilus harrisii]
MFRFMRDGEPEDPMFLMDPFAIHRQHMSRMLSGGFGYSPFLSITDGSIPGARPASRRMQAGAVSPFGMLGMTGGFMDMFGMMNDMIGNVEHMTTGANCQTFSSSTVISYSNLGDGAPKVYQETSEMRSAPGGVMLKHLTTSGGERRPDTGHSAPWNFVVMRPLGRVGGEGPKDPLGWLSRALRIPPLDSHDAMTGEGPSGPLISVGGKGITAEG